MDATDEFSCNQCGKYFEEEVFLFLHQYKNHDKTPFRCEECGESGEGQQKLYYHMKSHREARLKIYRCHLCPFEEPKLDVFQKHAQLHDDETEKAQREAESKSHSSGKDFRGQDTHDEHNLISKSPGATSTTLWLKKTQCMIEILQNLMLRVSTHKL